MNDQFNYKEIAEEQCNRRYHTEMWKDERVQVLKERAELLAENELLRAEVSNLHSANDMLAEYAKSTRHDYTELLYAVGKKYPDETRHETALRYIRQAEAPQNDMCKDEALEQKS